MKNKIKDKIVPILVAIGIGLIFVLSILYIYSFSGTTQVKLNFSQSVLDKLRDTFDNTNEGYEFVGYLYGENNNIDDFSLIGYKALSVRTGGSVVVDTTVPTSEITIHSHPDSNIIWGCWISPIDKMSSEETVCIYCRNKIKCYNIK